MSSHFFIQFLALGAMIAFYVSPNPILADSIYYAVLFGHLVLQFFYSPIQVRYLTQGPALGMRLAVLSSLFGLVLWGSVPLSWYFGIHFVFGEVFLIRFGEPHSAQVKGLRSLCYGGIFLLLLYQTCAEVRWVPLPVIAMAVAGGYGGLLYLRQKSKELGSTVIYDGVVLGIFAVLAVLARYRLKHIVFFHFVWWFFWPLLKPGRAPTPILSRYLWLSLGVTGVFFLLTPQFPFLGLSATRIEEIVSVGANLHITLSFALSTTNPDFINSFFQPQGGTAVPALPFESGPSAPSTEVGGDEKKSAVS